MSPCSGAAHVLDAPRLSLRETFHPSLVGDAHLQAASLRWLVCRMITVVVVVALVIHKEIRYDKENRKVRI